MDENKVQIYKTHLQGFPITKIAFYQRNKCKRRDICHH